MTRNWDIQLNTEKVMLKTMDVSFFYKNVAKNMVKKFLNHVKESGTNAFNTPLKSVIQKTVETAGYFVGN